ncbi:MAG: outer membrane beta-barrel protein [Bacteroidota bacterium]
MKQCIWLVKLVIVITITLYGESSYAQVFVGPKVGFQASQAIFEDKSNLDELDVDPVLGYSLGAVVAFKIRKSFFLHTEYIYSRKGKQIKGTSDPLLDHRVVYDHFDIPILLRTNFKSKVGGSRFFDWFVLAGPNVSYWLGGRGEIASSELIEQDFNFINYTIAFEEQGEDIEVFGLTDVNRLQLGLNLGFGVAFEPSPLEQLVLDFRVEIGHTFIGSNEQSNLPVVLLDYRDDLRATNNALKISLAYVFGFKPEESKKGKSTNKFRPKRK